MQNRTTFDLNRAIKNWRARVTNSPAFRNENVDELESHLRDSINRLQAGGLSEEESWVIAQKRLGQIDSLEQEFAKLAVNSAQPSSRRSARLVRSFSAVGVGVIVAILLSFLGEWNALQSYLEQNQPDTLNEERFQDFSNFTQFAVLSVLMAALVGGYFTALIAKHHPVRHALAASGVLWGCIAIIRGLQVNPLLLWQMTGAAMTGAMVLGALLCERHRPRWRIPMFTDGDFGRLSRRTGVLSVCCMIVCIVVGLAERLFPNIALQWLHPIEVWLLWATLIGWSLTLCLVFVRRLRFGKTARLA